jgi:hypothetical protein
MIQLLIGVGLLVAVLWALNRMSAANPVTIGAFFRKHGLTLLAIAGGIVVLALLMRSPNVLLGLLAFLAPIGANLWRTWKANRSLGGGWSAPGQGTQPAGESTVNTEYLRMSLEHGSGQMGGVVLKGRFAGRALSDLPEPALRDLHAEAVADPDSHRVLEAYLDRRLGPDWRSRFGAQAQPEEETASPRQDMTRDQALDVLGLQPGATAEQIKAAHRRLMQVVHPDKGGSGWLAARINRAKDVLLDT